MSINDLLDADLTIPIIIFFVTFIIVAPIGIAIGKKTNNNIYGDNDYESSVDTQNAKIITKKTSPHPLTQTVMVNMVVFEFSDGNRVELAIKDPTVFGVMVEGDCGVLKYQGKKFISFKRNIQNEA